MPVSNPNRRSPGRYCEKNSLTCVATIREHYATKADLANFELRLMRLFGIVSAIAGFAFAIGKQLIESLGIG